NEALARFEAIDKPKAELVKLRYFAGLTILEAAEALGISTTTADRHWAYARAWLHAELKRDGQSSVGSWGSLPDSQEWWGDRPGNSALYSRDWNCTWLKASTAKNPSFWRLCRRRRLRSAKRTSTAPAVELRSCVGASSNSLNRMTNRKDRSTS